MIIEINKNVVYVKGAKNGAIYNLNTGNVYSINHASCDVVEKYLADKILSLEEQEYIKVLFSNALLEKGFSAREYTPQKVDDSLDMCWLEITQQCNCRCLHCYEGDIHQKLDDSLRIEDWYKVIDQIKENNVQRVVVIGGEPCLHPEITKVVNYLALKEIDTTVFSNGTCLSNELKRTMSQHKIRFKCSLYGHTPEVHDRITQHPGSFKQLITNIHYFQEHGVEVTAAIVIMKENEAYFEDILSFVKSIGVKYKFDVIREVFGGKQSDHKPENMNIIHSVMRTSPHFKKVDKNKFDRAMQKNTCWSGKMAICEDGNILPCVFERNISYGNIKDKSIKDIMRSTCLQMCWNCSMEQIDNCQVCEFRFACKDCRPLATACGNEKGKNPRCTYNVYEGVWNG